MVFDDVFVLLVFYGSPWLVIGWLAGKCRWVVKEDRLKRDNQLLARRLAGQVEATHQAETTLESLVRERKVAK